MEGWNDGNLGEESKKTQSQLRFLSDPIFQYSIIPAEELPEGINGSDRKDGVQLD